MEKNRNELHLKIATSIEKVFAGRIDEFYGTLAHHYSKAGQKIKAEEYLIKAGDLDLESAAHPAAYPASQRSLPATEDVPAFCDCTVDM
jgi:predicted ATPase